MKIRSKEEIQEKLSEIDLKIKKAEVEAKRYPFDRSFTYYIKTLAIQKKQWELYLKFINEVSKGRKLTKNYEDYTKTKAESQTTL